MSASGGKDTILHSFKGGNDGAYPMAGLWDLHGTLHGTTFGEGTGSDFGTVFALTP
jgi:uncharacterized repeat protein (TIGR03803 family)